jgi:sugar lactone lactonase YvrE
MNKKIVSIMGLLIILLGAIYYFVAKSDKITTEKKVKVVNKLEIKKSEKEQIIINGVEQNPEGIEYNEGDKSFLLSSLNARPIIKVKKDGSFEDFTSGDKFPLSTAGLEIDQKRKRLLVAGFNGIEMMDNNPKTKGISILRIYNLETGYLEKEVNLSSLAPKAEAYFANDIAVDDDGNAYITD